MSATLRGTGIRLSFVLVGLLASTPVFALEPGTILAADEHLRYWVETLAAHPMKLVRKNAARVLGTLSRPEAVEPLATAALKDADGGVRLEAVRSLGMLGDERAFSSLYGVSEKDGDGYVRRAAADSIARIQAYLENQKKEKEKLERRKEREAGVPEAPTR